MQPSEGYHYNVRHGYFEITPEVESPEGPLLLPIKSYIKLYPHQKSGVRFLWSLHNRRHRGGILADDMGLGKTVQTVVFLDALFHSGMCRRVLILAPLSMLPAWQSAVETWSEYCQVYAHHKLKPKQREEAMYAINDAGDDGGGVCITTYGMASSEQGKLDMVKWDYVVCDEAHLLKNPSTKMHKAVRDLRSRRRILLTGTPVQNNLRELWALMAIAVGEGLFGTLAEFKQYYEAPIVAGADKRSTLSQREEGRKATDEMKKLIMPYVLRRTKSDVLQTAGEKQEANADEAVGSVRGGGGSGAHERELFIGTKHDMVVWIKLAPAQKNLYQRFLSSDSIKEALNSTRSPVAAISVLKRLCDHPLLVLKDKRLGDEEQALTSSASLPSDDAIREAVHAHVLAQASNGVRYTDLQMEQIMAKAMETNRNNHTQEETSMKDLIEAGLVGMDSELTDMDAQTMRAASLKLDIVIRLLESQVGSSHKTLVFSQSRQMLDMIAECLYDVNLRHTRIDGSVDATERMHRLEAFNDGDSLGEIMLLTTQTGGLGLTINSADTVIIVDPAWNPAVDNQAVDRCYRIGQKKDVRVFRLMTCGTVEEKMYRRQVYKTALANTASTGATKVKNPRYFSREDMRDLFTLGDTDRSATVHRVVSSKANTETSATIDRCKALVVAWDGVVGVMDHSALYKIEMARRFSKSKRNGPAASSTPVESPPDFTKMRSGGEILLDSDDEDAATSQPADLTEGEALRSAPKKKFDMTGFKVDPFGGVVQMDKTSDTPISADSLVTDLENMHIAGAGPDCSENDEDPATEEWRQGSPQNTGDLVAKSELVDAGSADHEQTLSGASVEQSDDLWQVDQEAEGVGDTHLGEGDHVQGSVGHVVKQEFKEQAGVQQTTQQQSKIELAEQSENEPVDEEEEQEDEDEEEQEDEDELDLNGSSSDDGYDDRDHGGDDDCFVPPPPGPQSPENQAGRLPHEDNPRSLQRTDLSHSSVVGLRRPLIPSNAVIEFMTDVEGNLEYFEDLVARSAVLSATRDGSARSYTLARHGYVVHGGDAVDKGPGDIRVVKALVQLKRDYPDRVFLICGNRDINKLRFGSELASGRTGASTNVYWDPKHTSYDQFVSENGLDPTMTVSTLKWMLSSTMGSATTFETRRMELATIWGVGTGTVSDDDVVSSFRDSVDPKHEDPWMLEYIKMTQIMCLIADCCFVHGGLSATNLGLVPGRTERCGDMDEWCAALNGWFREGIAKYVAQPTFASDGKTRNHEDVLDYGLPNGNKGGTVIYASHVRDGNCTIPDDEVVSFLRASGVRRLFTGHQPHGECPSVIQAAVSKAFGAATALTVYMCDTSYSDVKADKSHNPSNNRGMAVSTVSITADSTKVSGILSDGSMHEFTHEAQVGESAMPDELVGKQLPDESWVKTIPAPRTGEEKEIQVIAAKGKGFRLPMTRHLTGDVLRSMLADEATPAGQLEELEVFRENEGSDQPAEAAGGAPVPASNAVVSSTAVVSDRPGAREATIAAAVRDLEDMLSSSDEDESEGDKENISTKDQKEDEDGQEDVDEHWERDVDDDDSGEPGDAAAAGDAADMEDFPNLTLCSSGDDSDDDKDQQPAPLGNDVQSDELADNSTRSPATMPPPPVGQDCRRRGPGIG